MPSQQQHNSARQDRLRLSRWLASGPGLAAAALVAWETLVRIAETRPTSLPSPSRVLLELWRHAPQYRRHTAVTLSESLEGLLLASIAAVVLGSLLASRASFGRVTGTVLGGLGRVPVITLAPLMVIWFGYGFPSAVANSFLACFLPLLSGLLAGFASLPPETEEILLAMGASRAIYYRKVRLPACLPYLTAGLKISVPLAFAGAAVAEFVGSDEGLGFMMQYAGSTADATQLFAALALLVAMILCLHLMLSVVERKWIAWAEHLHTVRGACPGSAADSSLPGRAQ